MFVKICGLREAAHVEAAVEAGADAIGFVLTPSPRQVTPAQAAALAAIVPPEVLTVAVFATETPAQIRATATEAGVTGIQLHGGYQRDDFAALDDLGATVIRAVAGATDPDIHCGDWGEDLLIVDATRPGSGETWDWAGLAARPSGKWLLAGGLNPDNVAAAVAAVDPWGVDVSSGVEVARGVKSKRLIARFIHAVRNRQP